MTIWKDGGSEIFAQVLNSSSITAGWVATDCMRTMRCGALKTRPVFQHWIPPIGDGISMSVAGFTVKHVFQQWSLLVPLTAVTSPSLYLGHWEGKRIKETGLSLTLFANPCITDGRERPWSGSKWDNQPLSCLAWHMDMRPKNFPDLDLAWL